METVNHYTTYRTAPDNSPDTQNLYIETLKTNPCFAHTKKHLIKHTPWNKTLIDKYLGQPDIIIPALKDTNNPHPEKLYLCERVRYAERYASFQARLPVHARIDEKHIIRDILNPEIDQHTLIHALENTELNSTGKNLNKETLYIRACDVANNQYTKRTNRPGPYSTSACDEPTLYRISVNYLRHSETNYDTLIQKIEDAGLSLPYADTFRIHITRTIAENYPFLEEECERQLNLRGLSLHTQ